MISRKRSVWLWIICPLLAVVLYVLSIGPVYAATWAYARGVSRLAWIESVVAVVYLPVEWARKKSSAIDSAVDRYENDCMHWIIRHEGGS